MPDVSRDVLRRTAVGLAIRQSDEVLWSNPAFDRVAESLGATPDELGKRAAQDGMRLSDSRGVAYEVSIQRGESDELIQILPIGERRAESFAPRIDDATGVLTRQALRAEVQAWFHRRADAPFALVFLDLDRFKAVNDRLGHVVGDECLSVIGDRLRQLIRSNDVVGRFGGDEFVILLAGVVASSAFEPIAARIRGSLASPIETRSGSVVVGASLGVAYSNGTYTESEEMLAAADRDMYRGKALPTADVADSARFG